MKVKIGPYRKKKEREIKIHIDKWDTWSMDHTLALIALPMLKQLKETAHGSQMVDLEDVPVELRYISYAEYDSQKCFDFYNDDEKEGMLHQRWEWVLGEMIFAMEEIVRDDDSQFYKHLDKTKYKTLDEQIAAMECDWIGLTNYYGRMDNGLRLFGKYFRGLWD